MTDQVAGHQREREEAAVLQRASLEHLSALHSTQLESVKQNHADRLQSKEEMYLEKIQHSKDTYTQMLNVQTLNTQMDQCVSSVADLATQLEARHLSSEQR